MAVSRIRTATAVVVGDASACALLASGTTDCWGSNDSGELGNGTTTASDTPVAVRGIKSADAISAGVAACALLASGAIDCWGYNGTGELGNGTTNESDRPVAVSGITNATAISAGYGSACALLATGAIDCWGYGGGGKLGNGTMTIDSATPVAVSGITNATAVSVGGESACTLLDSGAIDCWGSNVGNGTATESDTPVQVSGLP